MASKPGSTLSSAASKQTKSPRKHHWVRTLFSSLFGMVALLLVLASIIVVWVNRTLTDTDVYVSTVSPLVTKPAIQNFVAQKATQQILQNTPLPQLGSALLTNSQQTSVSTDTMQQLQSLLQPIVNQDVLQIIRSAEFKNLWISTNRSAQQQLVSELNSNSSSVTLNLNPLITGVISELKTTTLSSVSGNINVSPTAGVLNFKGSVIQKMHSDYVLFKRLTWAIVIVTLLLIVLCIWISVHHLKTFRRIAIAVAVIALLLASLVQVTSFIKPGGSNSVQQAAIVAIAHVILHNLQVAMLILGVSCLVLVVASVIFQKLYYKNPSHKSVAV